MRIVDQMHYRPTVIPTDRPMDTASYIGALAHLKTQFGTYLIGPVMLLNQRRPLIQARKCLSYATSVLSSCNISRLGRQSYTC